METSSVQDKQEHISVCDIMKGNTSEIIMKFESQIPRLLENYSNLYAESLHIFDDVFGTCYIHEKEFFDKLNIDQSILKQLKDNSDSIKNQYIKNIEFSTTFLDEQFKIRISMMQSFQTFAHTMMESYAKSLSQFNQKLNSK